MNSTRVRTSSVEDQLLLQENRQELSQVFGSEYVRQLEALAAEANRVRTRGGVRVLILPGIMGSTLGIGGNTIWIDPIDIRRGNLTSLALKENDRVDAEGVFLPTYLELKLRLQIAGFRAEFFPYDWRDSIQEQSKLLVERIQELNRSHERISLVAHSMGGLIARAALKKIGKIEFEAIEQCVLLGTPNSGSFAPAQVLTADYSTTDWITRLDKHHSGTELVEKVYSTFVGLCQMLPAPAFAGGIDLFDPSSYPPEAPRLKTAVLESAWGLQDDLAGGVIMRDNNVKKIKMIAGVGIETVVGVRVTPSKPDGFELDWSSSGDGTVPLALARLNGADHRFCQVAHGKLPTDNEVIRATIDLLRHGSTERLSSEPDSLLRQISRTAVSELHSARRYMDRDEKIEQPDHEELRNILEPLAAPGEVETVVTTATSRLELTQEPIVIARKHQQRIDLQLGLGPLSSASGRAVLLGIFSDIRPGGASIDIDQQIGGLISEVIERRMYSANLGEIFVLPTPRRNLSTEMVVLVGLGTVSNFTEETLRFAFENATRTLLRCQVDDFVTIPIGAGCGLELNSIIRAMFNGLIAALKDAGDRPSLRGLTICEISQTGYERLTNCVLHLATSPHLDDLEITIEQLKLQPHIPVIHDRKAVLTSERDRNYLIVRQNTESGTALTAQTHLLDYTLLTGGNRAIVLTEEKIVDAREIKTLLGDIQKAVSKTAGFQAIDDLGVQAGELLIPPLIREALIKEGLRFNEQTTSSGWQLTIVHDAWNSKIPWELVSVDGFLFGKHGNLNRSYATDNLSVAKWLHERRFDSTLRFLLVVNPTGDLSGTVAEGKAIKEFVAEHDKIELITLEGPQATRESITDYLESGEIDIFHYAGHAFFDPDDRSSSGIVCAGNSVLSARDLLRLKSLPALAVFNACESGRIRARALPPKRISKGKSEMRDYIDRNVSFAEAMLKGGIANYVGTYWPVGDAAAADFAESFYGVLLGVDDQERTIGNALRAARNKLYEQHHVDWADYIHYGEPAFQLKIKS